MDEHNLDRELDALYAAITGRRFSYDPGSDPLYRITADRYIQNGRLAMRDTMGQAAALTGGYSSSYSQTVGQQQYDEYLRALADAMPELYELAYRQYSAEGDALQNAYDLSYQRAERDYRRGRDAAADEAAREQRDYDRGRDAYDRLCKLITGSGYNPTDEELAEAGLTRGQADALLAEYKRSHKPRASGSSGGRRRSGKAKEDKADDAAAPGSGRQLPGGDGRRYDAIM